jgi:hypothetical protein
MTKEDEVMDAILKVSAYLENNMVGLVANYKKFRIIGLFHMK